MDKNGSLYQSLKDEIDELKKRCATLEEGNRRILKLFNKHADWVLEELKTGKSEHWDNLSRISQLETKVFPGLEIDLEHLRRTIGPGEGASRRNPLDLRKKK
jgi:hypothetical protein